jgi:hypothetical protein
MAAASRSHMELEIAPHVGVGPITFGMTRAEVRRQVAAPATTFVKGPDNAVPTDAFDSLGIHVHYDSEDRCEAVEFGGSSAIPTFRDEPLLGQPVGRMERWLRAIDPEVRSDRSGLTSLTFGFGFYAPRAFDEPGSPVEGVIVFRRGYYDQDAAP